MKMGLLRSVKDVPNIDYHEYKENTYYNKYMYRAKFSIPGLSHTYNVKDSKGLMERVNATGYLRLRSDRKAMVLENKQMLVSYIDWRNAHKKQGHITFRLEGDTASIYSNDLELLLTLKTITKEVEITEVKLEQFAGTKYYVRTPKHKYRIYLKTVYIKDKTFITDLDNTLKKNKELVPSPSLKGWLRGYKNSHLYSWRYQYASGSHSIDYDNESTLSYLVLMYGDMLGKRYKLEKRPEPV
jgi:hypothetical protein